jgi:hypothetical protein
VPLCFLAVIGTPLFLSMGWTHARFLEMATVEKAVIGLDNASIVAGQSARAVWRGLQNANRQMRALDIAHHLAHACARAPLPNPPCRVADAAFEARLRLFHAWSGNVARGEWAAGKKRALARAHALGSGEAHMEREALPPIRPVHCKICGLPVAWEQSRPHRDWLWTRVHARVFRNVVESVGKSLTGNDRWQYRVREVENGN